MIRKIINFPKKKDWKGYPLVRKIWMLSLITAKPMYAWKKYPDEFYRALEIDNIETCKDRTIMEEVLKIKYQNKTTMTLMSLREMINVFNLVKKVTHLEGDIAEVGVYQGGSALLISRAKGKKNLHLFDTFEGLPQTDKKYDILEEGDMSNTSLDMVKKNLEGYDNLYFYKGLFPDTAGPVENKKFCFVNLDTDIYSSTVSCLEFFYPRMVKGGILLTHDYGDTRTPGVKKAYDEFFADKPEFIIEIWDTQAYAIKT